MSAPDEHVLLAFWLNGRPYPVNERGEHLQIRVAENRYHVLDLPVKAADVDGNLTIRIANVNLYNMRATFPAGVSFTPGDGLEFFIKWIGLNPTCFERCFSYGSDWGSWRCWGWRSDRS